MQPANLTLNFLPVLSSRVTSRYENLGLLLHGGRGAERRGLCLNPSIASCCPGVGRPRRGTSSPPSSTSALTMGSILALTQWNCREDGHPRVHT